MWKRTIKIKEVAQVIRTRTVTIDMDDDFKYPKYDLDEGDEAQLNHITRLVREQACDENYMTEQVLTAEFLEDE